MKNMESVKQRVYISPMAGKPLKDYLKRKGFEISYTKATDKVYQEISSHTDIYMCQIDLWEKSHIFSGDISLLKEHYPGNIIYNALCTGSYFIHNLKYTSTGLLEHIRRLYQDSPLIEVHVPQGYTRCTCLAVDDRSFITSDMGTAKALSARGCDVLLIRPAHIRLPGFDYGFIGGTAGNLIVDGKKTIVFNGDISKHPDYKKIAAFIKDRCIDIMYFSEYPLEDIGSILIESRGFTD